MPSPASARHRAAVSSLLLPALLLAFLLPLSSHAQSPAPVITSPTTATAWIGEMFSYTITASVPAQRGTGPLPGQLSLSWIDATGTLTGTPQFTGVFAIPLIATNEAGTSHATLTLTVLPNRLPPAITNTLLDLPLPANQGWAYSISAENFPSSFDATGLPPGAIIDRERGTIHGAATTPGSYNVVLSATNAFGTSVALLRLKLLAPGTAAEPERAPSISSPLHASTQVGSAFAYAVTASNSPASFTATNLPSGLTLNASTGMITGQPGAPGRFNIPLRAQNAFGYDLRTLALDVAGAPPPVVNPPPPATGVAARLASPTEIHLTWPAHPTATFYRIERSVSGGAFAEFARTTALRWINHTLDAGTTYLYRVHAVESRTGGDVLTALGSSNPVTTPSWSSADIGAVAVPGSVSHQPGVLVVSGSGADIWGMADEFHFAHQSWTGDGILVAQVNGVQNVDPWTKAGIMIRESLAPGARYIMAYLRPDGTGGIQSRSVTGGDTAHLPGWRVISPMWLKIVRRGDAFEAFQSQDAGTWTSLGSVTIPLPPTAQVGAFVTSHRDGTLTRVGFLNVSISADWNPANLPAPANFTARRISATQIELTWQDTSAFEDGFIVEHSQTDRNFIYEPGNLNPGFPLTGNLPANTTRLIVNQAWGALHFRIHSYSFVDRTLNLNVGSTFAYAYAPAATGGDPPPPPVTPPPPPPTNPPTTPGWQTADIGAVARAGGSTESGDAITLTASGADIWDNTDEFHFRSTAWTGDGEIIARVTSLTNTNGWAKAGLMFRESLSGPSRHVFLCATPANGTAFQRRTVTGGASDTTGGPGRPLPQWLRLVRAGNTFTGYESADGSTWNRVGEISLALPASIHVGLAATSHNDGVLTTAGFDRITLSGVGAPPPPSLPAPTSLAASAASSSQINLTWNNPAAGATSLELQRSLDGASFTTQASLAPSVSAHTVTGLAAGTTYYFRLRAAQGAEVSAFSTIASATTLPTSPPPPPTGWETRDIGAVAVAGTATETGGTVTLTGSGADIWDNADEFRFRYVSLTGDGQIVARVTSLTNTHGWAKAGLMLRETLTPTSRHAFMCVAVQNGAVLQHRAATAGGSVTTQAPLFTPLPRWLRLVRSGSTIRGYHSTDGTTWLQAGSITLDLPTTVHLGLAVTSHNDGILATGVFDNVAITGAGPLPPVLPPPLPPAPPPTPSAWVEADIGTIAFAGSHDAAGNRITLRGAGADIWDGADSFHFLGRAITGDVTIETQVSSLTSTHAWAKAGVMIRESLEPGARNVFACLTAANGSAAQQRSITNGPTSIHHGPWGATAPHWVRLVRRGNAISAYASADGATWTLMQSFTFDAPATAYVGFAITSHDPSQLATTVLTDPFIQ